MGARAGAPVEAVDVATYRIPTDSPESDGTLEWDATTLVVVHVRAGGASGVGYTYGSAAAAAVVRDELAAAVRGRDALDPPGALEAMRRAVRNSGHGGIAALAASAVDVALWDAKAKLLGLPLARLLGARRASVDAYGSGGFTSYPVDRLRAQLAGWTEEGFLRVKMKVGRDPEADAARVAAARQAIGSRPELFVDANGAYDRKGAIAKAEAFAALGVTWLEEPVSSEDLEGLRLVRDRAPAPVRVAAGEYAWQPLDALRLLQAGAVDVLQADATRCGGITGFMAVAALADAWGVPLSAHCAPSLHVHPMCAAGCGVHLEYFHDHARVEQLLLEGAPRAKGGALRPDLSRPGLGIELRRADAERFAT